MKRALLVANPISGTLSKEGLPEKVLAALAPRGYSVEHAATERPGHAAELAGEAAAAGYDAVIAAGGDGTVNEVGSALRDTRTAMGILPFGSGNGLARHLGLSADPAKALSLLARDAVADCDYGTVNGRPFFCTFGMGFDANVSRRFASMPSRGLASYLKSVIGEYAAYSPGTYEITTHDHRVEVRAFLVAVCNASQYGNNAYIAPGASIRDGLLDIVVVHAGNPLSRALMGIDLMTGRMESNLLVQTMRVRHATISRLPGHAHIDGDPLLLPQTLDVRCHPGAIRLFTDPSKGPFRPFLTPAESLREDMAGTWRRFWGS